MRQKKYRVLLVYFLLIICWWTRCMMCSHKWDLYTSEAALEIMKFFFVSLGSRRGFISTLRWVLRPRVAWSCKISACEHGLCEFTCVQEVLLCLEGMNSLVLFILWRLQSFCLLFLWLPEPWKEAMDKDIWFRIEWSKVSHSQHIV